MVGRKVRDAALQLIRWRRIWTCTRTEPTRYRSTAVSCMVENTLRGSRLTLAAAPPRTALALTLTLAAAPKA